jgi:hypothetical protein
MAKAKRLKMSVEVITDLLPEPPDGFTYEVEQFSPLVHRVWIVNHGTTFSYTSEPVKSVWGFVKSTGDVVLPKNHLKITSKKVCHVTEIPQSMKYSTINSTYVGRITQLTDFV